MLKWEELKKHSHTPFLLSLIWDAITTTSSTKQTKIIFFLIYVIFNLWNKPKRKKKRKRSKTGKTSGAKPYLWRNHNHQIGVNVNGRRNQWLWLNLPKSASFLDLFAQNAAAVDRFGLVWTLISPGRPISGGIPFWFHCLLGLALTNGLMQNANPDTFRPRVGRARRVAGAVAVGVLRQACDSDEYPLADGEKS